MCGLVDFYDHVFFQFGIDLKLELEDSKLELEDYKEISQRKVKDMELTKIKAENDKVEAEKVTSYKDTKLSKILPYVKPRILLQERKNLEEKLKVQAKELREANMQKDLSLNQWKKVTEQ